MSYVIKILMKKYFKMEKSLILILVFLFTSCNENQKKIENRYRCGETSKWGVQYCKDLSKDDFYLIYHHGIKIGEGIPMEKTDFINGKIYYNSSLYTGFVFDGYGNNIDKISEYNQGDLILVNTYETREVNNISSFRRHSKIILKKGEVEKIITFNKRIGSGLINGRIRTPDGNRYDNGDIYYDLNYENMNENRGGFVIDYFNGDKELDSTQVFYLNGKKKGVVTY